MTLSALVHSALALGTAGLSIRYLGASDAGLSMTVISSLAMIEALGGLGIAEASLRRLSALIAQDRTAEAEVAFSSALLLSFGTYLLIFVAVFLSARSIVGALGYEDLALGSSFLCIMAMNMVARQLFVHLLIPLYASQRFVMHSSISLISGIVSTLATLWSVMTFRSLLAMAIAGSAVSVIQLLTCVIDPFKSRRIYAMTRISWMEVRGLLVFGKSIAAVRLLAVLTNGFDRVLLANQFGTAAIPLYNLPRRMYEACHQLFNRQASFLFPLLSSKTEEEAGAFVSSIQWEYLFVASYVYLGVAGVGFYVISFLVGDQFASQAYPYLVLFSVVGVLKSIEVVMYPLVNATGRPHHALFAQIASATATLSLMYGLIQMEKRMLFVAFGQLGILTSPLVVVIANYGFGKGFHLFGGLFLSPILPFLVFIVGLVLATITLDGYEMFAAISVLLLAYPFTVFLFETRLLRRERPRQRLHSILPVANRLFRRIRNKQSAIHGIQA